MRRAAPLPISIARVPFTLESALRRGVTRRRTRAIDLWTPSRGIRVPRATTFELLDNCRTLTEVTPNGVISHLTAARIHGFYLPWRFGEQTLFDVARPMGEGRPRRKGVHGRELELGPRDVVIYSGVRVTTAQRTLLDIAPLLTVEELVAIADQLVCEHHRTFGPHVYPTVPLDELNAYLAERPGHRGMRKLRAAMELVRVGSDSARESALRLMIGRSPLPTFEHNVEIINAAGKGLVGPDLACKEYKTCAEYDGKHHFTPAQHAKDHDRDFITRAQGWHQVLINNDDIRAGELVVVTKIARALKLGGWPDPQNLAGRSLKGLLNTRKDFG
ncbi:endonuclease domain-containing protein [Arthrobacter sp. TMN-49]